MNLRPRSKLLFASPPLSLGEWANGYNFPRKTYLAILSGAPFCFNCQAAAATAFSDRMRRTSEEKRGAERKIFGWPVVVFVVVTFIYMSSSLREVREKEFLRRMGRGERGNG